MTTIRVGIADDQALIRDGLRVQLGLADDVQVVGEARTGGEAVELARSAHPAVLLMDIRMPGMDGIEATRRIGADPATSGTRVLVLTTFDLDEYVYDALAAGASGFLLKDATPEELLHAVRVVAAGEALLDPAVTRRLIDDIARRRSPARRADEVRLTHLTDREREVLELIGRGLSNAQLADRLVISQATAKTHVSRILTKLDAHDRAQLVVLAYESGLVTPGT